MNSEKATKFEKTFHVKFDVTEWKIFSNFMAFSEYPDFPGIARENFLGLSGSKI